MTDLDRDLAELGAYWRSVQPAPFAHVASVITADKRQRGRVVGLAVAFLVVAAVTIVAFAVTRDGSTRSVRITPAATPTNTNASSAPEQATLAESGVIDFSAQAGLVETLAASHGTIWAAGYPLEGSDGHAPLFAIDAAGNSVTQTFSLPVTYPIALDVNGSDIWLRGDADNATFLVKLDGATGAVLGSRQLTQDGGLAVTSTDVWALERDQLLHIDPNTLDTISAIPVPGGSVFITAGPTGIWLANPYDGDVSHVNTTTNRVDATVHAGDHLSVMTELNESVWVLNNTELIEINATTTKVVARVPLGRRARDLTTDGTALYIAGDGTNVVERVDPNTLSLTPIEAPPRINSATSITYDPDTRSLWVANGTLTANIHLS